MTDERKLSLLPVCISEPGRLEMLSVILVHELNLNGKVELWALPYGTDVRRHLAVEVERGVDLNVVERGDRYRRSATSDRECVRTLLVPNVRQQPPSHHVRWYDAVVRDSQSKRELVIIDSLRAEAGRKQHRTTRGEVCHLGEPRITPSRHQKTDRGERHQSARDHIEQCDSRWVDRHQCAQHCHARRLRRNRGTLQ